eukprot:318054-Prorocentrum_minimum.AAC.4
MDGQNTACILVYNAGVHTYPDSRHISYKTFKIECDKFNTSSLFHEDSCGANSRTKSNRCVPPPKPHLSILLSTHKHRPLPHRVTTRTLNPRPPDIKQSGCWATRQKSACSLSAAGHRSLAYDQADVSTQLCLDGPLVSREAWAWRTLGEGGLRTEPSFPVP